MLEDKLRNDELNDELERQEPRPEDFLLAEVKPEHVSIATDIVLDDAINEAHQFMCECLDECMDEYIDYIGMINSQNTLTKDVFFNSLHAATRAKLALKIQERAQALADNDR